MSLEGTATKFLRIINEEANKFGTDDKYERIILIGFGQGCSTVLTTFLMYTGTSPLGGVVCMSGLLPLKDIPEKTLA
tara:strand:+ start:1202 stop:1432 length:231 start_codon:yes stop_codon:yes gene_type:complete